MRMRFPWRSEDLWILPGGGMESGESAQDAVVREVFEETGQSQVVPQAQIWRREFLVDATQVLMRQRYFLIPIVRFSPSASALLGDEGAWLQEYRWWSIVELQREQPLVEPPLLTDALQILFKEGIPSQPIDVDLIDIT